MPPPASCEKLTEDRGVRGRILVESQARQKLRNQAYHHNGVSPSVIRYYDIVSITLHATSAVDHHSRSQRECTTSMQAICARTATVASSYREYQKYHREYPRCTQQVRPCFLARIWARHRNDKGLPPTT